MSNPLDPGEICAYCHSGPDPFDSRMVILSYGWLHSVCADRLGNDPEAIAQLKPCCEAQKTVRMMCGKMSQEVLNADGASSVPGDQWWFADNRTKTLRRYQLQPDGALKPMDISHSDSPPPKMKNGENGNGKAEQTEE